MTWRNFAVLFSHIYFYHFFACFFFLLFLLSGEKCPDFLFTWPSGLPHVCANKVFNIYSFWNLFIILRLGARGKENTKYIELLTVAANIVSVIPRTKTENNGLESGHVGFNPFVSWKPAGILGTFIWGDQLAPHSSEGSGGTAQQGVRKKCGAPVLEAAPLSNVCPPWPRLISLTSLTSTKKIVMASPGPW